MKPGTIIRASKVTHVELGGNTTFDLSPNIGVRKKESKRVFVFAFLGMEKLCAKDKELLDVDQAMKQLGWCKEEREIALVSMLAESLGIHRDDVLKKVEAWLLENP